MKGLSPGGRQCVGPSCWQVYRCCISANIFQQTKRPQNKMRMYSWDTKKLIGIVPRHALHSWGVEKYKGQYTVQQARTKNGRCPADKPVVNRSLCSSIGLHRVCYVCASRKLFKTIVSDAIAGERDSSYLCGPFCRHPVLPRPDPSLYVRVLGLIIFFHARMSRTWNHWFVRNWTIKWNYHARSVLSVF